MARSVVQNMLLLGLTVLVCLGGAEVFFRLFPQYLSEEAQLRPHWQEVGQSESAQSMSVSDPRFGYLLRPHFTGQTSRGDFHFTFHTDEHGFRNPSPWPKQADVVVVGDLLAFGYGVDDDQARPRLVAKALPGITIINLGLAGFGPQQYLRVLESYGFALHPKLVLFMLFSGNDLTDARAFQEWLDADTDLSYQEWQMTGGEFRRSGGLVAAAAAQPSCHLSPWRSQVAVGAAQGWCHGGHDRIRGWPPRPARADRAAIQPRAGASRRSDLRAGDGDHRAGARPQPRAWQPVPGAAHADQGGGVSAADRRAAAAVIEAFRAALDRRGIPFLDLTPDLQAHARDAAPLFYQIDGHPNADGYRLIARVVADHLKEFGLGLGRPGETGSASQSEPVDAGRGTF